MNDQYIVVFCTVSGPEEGAKIGRALVEEKAAACVNIIGSIRSIYSWEGKICDDPESMLIIKTQKDGFEKLRGLIQKLHSYDTPEIMALPIVAGSQKYLDWIDESLKPDRSTIPLIQTTEES